MDELLAALNEALARAAAGLTELSPEELDTLDAEITAAAVALGEHGNLTDEAVEALTAAGTSVQAIRAEQDSRDAAAAERAERAAAALALVRGDEAEEDEGEPEAEADPVVEDETPPVVEAETPAETETPAEVPVAVAASRRPLTRVAARRPAAAAPRANQQASSPFSGMHIVASANAPGLPSGQRITTYADMAHGFVAAVAASRGYRGPNAKIPIFTLGRGPEEYPESHRLSNNTALNMQRIEATQAVIRANGGLHAALRNGITAAGGICAPTDVRRDLPGVDATDARPMRDGFMTRFGVTDSGGGIRTLSGPVIEDLNGASSWWTEANDIDASDGTPTKTCLTVTCDVEETETLVEAAVQCLRYGNFRAMYFPQQITRWMELMGAAHARLAEQRLLATVSTGTTSALTIGQTLGTIRDLLAGLDRIRAVWNYRHRTPDSFTLAIALPRWLRDQIRSDVTRQLPVGSVTQTLAGLSDAEIDSLIRARGFEPTWLLDGESGQGFNAQGPAGTVQGWPSTVKTYVAPAGSWLHLDGGELNLGVMRDTVTTSTNDVQFFAETMENAHFHGIESWTVTFDTCPDGSTSATVDIAPCATGS